jgi:hypothetical protein
LRESAIKRERKRERMRMKEGYKCMLDREEGRKVERRYERKSMSADEQQMLCFETFLILSQLQ